MPSYEIVTQNCSWKLEPFSKDSWLLSRKTFSKFYPVDFYESPETAAQLIGSGRTGEKDWDALPHDSREFEISRWQFTK